MLQIMKIIRGGYVRLGFSLLHWSPSTSTLKTNIRNHDDEYLYSDELTSIDNWIVCFLALPYREFVKR